jgi:hypothetical protein
MKNLSKESYSKGPDLKSGSPNYEPPGREIRYPSCFNFANHNQTNK